MNGDASAKVREERPEVVMMIGKEIVAATALDGADRSGAGAESGPDLHTVYGPGEIGAIASAAEPFMKSPGMSSSRSSSSSIGSKSPSENIDNSIINTNSFERRTSKPIVKPIQRHKQASMTPSTDSASLYKSHGDESRSGRGHEVSGTGGPTSSEHNQQHNPHPPTSPYQQQQQHNQPYYHNSSQWGWDTLNLSWSITGDERPTATPTPLSQSSTNPTTNPLSPIPSPATNMTRVLSSSSILSSSSSSEDHTNHFAAFAGPRGSETGMSSSLGSLAGLNPNAKEWSPVDAINSLNGRLGAFTSSSSPSSSTSSFTHGHQHQHQQSSGLRLSIPIPGASSTRQKTSASANAGAEGFASPPSASAFSPASVVNDVDNNDLDLERLDSRGMNLEYRHFGPSTRRSSSLLSIGRNSSGLPDASLSTDWLDFDWRQDDMQQPLQSPVMGSISTTSIPSLINRRSLPPVLISTSQQHSHSRTLSRSTSLLEDMTNLNLNLSPTSPTASTSSLLSASSSSHFPSNFPFPSQNGPPLSSSASSVSSLSGAALPFNSGSANSLSRRSRKKVVIRPANPGAGTRGNPVVLLTNFYGMECPVDLEIYQYEVRISPETVSRVNRRVLATWKEVNNMREEFSRIVYDGIRNLYSPTRLPFVNDEIVTQVVLYDEETGGRRRVQRFTMKLRRVSDIRMDRLALFTEGKTAELPRDAIQALEVLLRQRPSSIFTTIGKGGGSFYSEQHNTPIANGLTVHQGWYQSVRPTFRRLLLNLDVSATSFYIAGPLIDTVAKFFNKPNIEAIRQHLADSHERKKLDRFLRDVTVEINYRTSGRKRYKIKGLTEKPVSQTLIVTTSPDKTKHIVPITSYFQDMYGVSLKYSWLPCVVSGTNGDCILPMEVCFVRKNQRHVGKLNDQQLADIVKLTAVLPEYRKDRVVEGMKQLHGQGSNEVLESWGVKVDTSMSVINGRILTPPPLIFGSTGDWNQVITPTDGTWRIGRGIKFAEPAALHTWAVAVFGDPTFFPIHTVCLFVKNVMSACVNLGMDVVERNIADLIVYAPAGRIGPECVEGTLRMADERARTVCGFGGFDMAAGVGLGSGFGVPGSTGGVGSSGYGGMVGYAPTPSILGPKVAQLVICVLAQKNTHVHVTKPSYSQNLALKINAKLGGVNSYIDPVNELGGLGASGIPTMLMGADVTHPQHGAADPSSIAAVVGTVDDRYCEYRSSIRVQNSRREILSDLEGMTRELFEMYRARNGCYPKRILFFRDGVAEGQLVDVSVEEISAFKRACVSLGLLDAKLTFTMVNKRHHGRFFPSRMETGEADSKGNILAGTVVDSGVTHPFEFDFYLTSHPGMQGTSKAAYYHVLHDDNKFTADELQEITYRLCYNLARSTRAVSIVPPAYFAHLVAARARCYASAPGGSSSMVSPVNAPAGWTSWTGVNRNQATNLSEANLPGYSGLTWGGITNSQPSPILSQNKHSSLPPGYSITSPTFMPANLGMPSPSYLVDVPMGGVPLPMTSPSPNFVPMSYQQHQQYHQQQQHQQQQHRLSLQESLRDHMTLGSSTVGNLSDPGRVPGIGMGMAGVSLGGFMSPGPGRSHSNGGSAASTPRASMMNLSSSAPTSGILPPPPPFPTLRKLGSGSTIASTGRTRETPKVLPNLQNTMYFT
ncbi:hypothetical protein HDU76_013990 [Blyttiomyces sp. JEL0837]|nr:hypothetical protein HDU76_013990 [Blyttiomyces sp. JEL0837]